ncbi:proprotein convertase P-domain-containing protein [Amycolatopsis sp. WQ 127309]|uniref:proprotein convertase P-domain-containing protein n=1 Tax=Amycolatopsis sp. WQ 127309 TaxID=2932773 RepID=UPI001FF0E989|nr:proprotein convertase P-domain-containing protein [Amycolatopsis sp. WQ 127309]UOZ11044.1 proprotein convertase P-domain-containing protein [Amycolatopsis sp. WQ 127309]
MRRLVSVAGVAALAALGLGFQPAQAAPPAPPAHPQAEVDGVAAAFGLSADQARTRLAAQDDAHRLAAALPTAVRQQSAGEWFDAAAGKLTVAVTTPAAADQVRATGAAVRVVARGQAELDRTDAAVRALVGQGVPGVYGWGVDVRNNEVGVSVDRTKKTAATESFLSSVREIGVRITETTTSPKQQSGTIQTGNPWWPGSESNCSVGFPVTDSSGAKHFLTAGHCTNDSNQAAYGASGQQNKVGTSNVGGTHSVNGQEGDMGLVAVTEAGWNLSASVNTWGQPAVTLSGAAEAMVGDSVCHSGNTSHWQCGEVKYTHKSADYGNGLIIGDLTWTTACSLGGDSGGGWLLGSKAAGLHDGGPSQCVQNPSDGDMSLFQPVIEALNKWQLSLVAGGGTGDTTAPSAPGNPRSTGTTASSVSLAWDASTDNTGVTGYDVYNGSTLATSVAGTSATVSGLNPDTAYSFTVKAKDAAGNASAASAAVSARTQAGGGGSRTLTNDTDYAIRDYQQVLSPISSTLTGSAAASIGVSLTIRHTCAEDLGITLLDPKGKAYALKYSGGSTCTPWSGARTFTIPATASSPAAGKWQLRVTDYGPGDTGTLDTWSITL